VTHSSHGPRLLSFLFGVGGVTRMRVLWVENHTQFVRVAGRQFLADHAVTVAPSLTDARAALAGGSFEVVLIDFDLDDGKGEELVRELRPMPGRPFVVAASSHEVGNQALVAAGADAVCGKLQFAHVGEVLRQLAGRTWAEAEPGAAADRGLPSDS
jgi:CheY-like chemotaxis protein